MKHIMVVGGAGFIGINFIKWMHNNHPEILLSVFDIMNYAGDYERNAKLDIIENCCKEAFLGQAFDITDNSSLDNAIKRTNANCTIPIDTIVNFAAHTHVDNSLHSPAPFWNTNINGAINVANDARRFNIRLHHISTDEVYGSVRPEDNVTEEFPLNPSSPYSASKASADLCLISMVKSLGAKITISRCTNNFGAYQHPEKFIPKMLTNIAQNRSIPVYGKGEQKRCWCHVYDHCEAIYTILEKGIIGEIYNVGGNTTLSNIDLVKKILTTCNKPESLIEFVEDRVAHDFLYQVNDAKLTKLGWKCQRTIDNYIKAWINPPDYVE